MSSACCPLCSASLSGAGWEGHLRQELNYPSLRCRLCPVEFTDDADAVEHFAGPLAKHPGLPPAFLKLAKEAEKEERLLELVRLVQGGPGAVEERLCVCGHCRLLCRQPGPALDALDVKPDRQRLKLHVPGPPPTHLIRPAHILAGRRPPSAEQAPESPVYRGGEEDEAPYDHMTDVKPAALEVKSEDMKEAEDAGDGRLACLLCSVRVTRDELKRHALMRHSETRPYACVLCPHAEKSKGELAKHQKRDHDLKLSPETFTFVGSEAEATELLEQCFGDARDSVATLKYRCKPCDKLVSRKELNAHVASVHLKKPLHACRLCDFVSTSTQASKARDHVKKAHKRPGGPDTLDSSAAEQFAPVIKGMVAQLFAKQ